VRLPQWGKNWTCPVEWGQIRYSPKSNGKLGFGNGERLIDKTLDLRNIWRPFWEGQLSWGEEDNKIKIHKANWGKKANPV